MLVKNFSDVKFYRIPREFVKSFSCYIFAKIIDYAIPKKDVKNKKSVCSLAAK